jgi:hypothetical protein
MYDPLFDPKCNFSSRCTLWRALRDSHLLQYKCEQCMPIALEFGVTKVVKGVLWLEVWRSYRLGKSFIIDVRPSRSVFLTTQMASGVRLLRPQAPTLSKCIRSARTIGPEARCFSLFTRPRSTYDEHIPLTPVGRLGLAISSGIGAFLDPRKGGTYHTA